MRKNPIQKNMHVTYVVALFAAGIAPSYKEQILWTEKSPVSLEYV